MVIEIGNWISFAAQNVVPGLIGVLLTGLTIRTWQKLQDFYLEQKFPITGEYISRFEDAKADERDSDIYSGKRTYTALEKLSQSGNTVTGTSQTEYRTVDAGWELTGEITNDGYLVGRYVAMNPHDQGHGTFFLYIRKNRHLDGIWAGYEDERGEINHGRYVLKPVLNVTIRPMKSGEISETAGLLELTGAGSEPIDRLRETSIEDSTTFTLTAREKQTRSSIFVSALETLGEVFGSDVSEFAKIETKYNTDSAFVGTVVGTVATKDLQDAFSLPLSDLPAAVRCADSVCIIDYVAVKNQFREQGVGTRLIDAVIDHFEGVDVICLAADPQQRSAIDGIMNSIGFETHHFESPDEEAENEQESLNKPTIYLIHSQ